MLTVFFCKKCRGFFRIINPISPNELTKASVREIFQFIYLEICSVMSQNVKYDLNTCLVYSVSEISRLC